MPSESLDGFSATSAGLGPRQRLGACRWSRVSDANVDGGSRFSTWVLAMNQLVRQALRPVIDFTRRRLQNLAERGAQDPFSTRDDSVNQQMQRNIVNQYLWFKANGIRPYPSIRDAGFRVYSQFEEDGIILYIFSMIGFKTRRVVEMCCGSGSECMATNLILNHGFDGYLFDGDPRNISLARRFFCSKKDCLLYPPVLSQGWITAENVNDLLTRAGCVGEVDLFSLDVDGNDYWIWDAVEVINPRLLVLETWNIIPSDRSLTIEYRADFDSSWNKSKDVQDYRGASLLAMQNLCKKRGYRMIGSHRHGFNVFFLRKDEGIDFFPEVDIQEIHNNFWTRSGQASRWPLVKDMPWKEV
jgi:hypothetical protein